MAGWPEEGKLTRMCCHAECRWSNGDEWWHPGRVRMSYIMSVLYKSAP